MTVFDAFALALMIITAVTVVMALGIAVLRVVRIVRLRRFDKVVADVRPAVLAALDDGGSIPEFDRRRRSVATSIATSLLPKLRGADRDALASILDENGVVSGAVSGLDSRSARRRQRSTALLGSAGHVEAVTRLTELLDDRDIDVRATACRALGRIGAAEAVPDLMRILGDGRLPANAVSMAVVRIGTDGADAIAASLDHESPLVRKTAAELAGSLGLIDLCSRIEALIDDPDAGVRDGAARALGRLSMPSSAGCLNQRLEVMLALPVDPADDDAMVAIIDALGRIGHRTSIPVLESCFARRHRVSFAATRALSAMGVRRSTTSKRERAAAEEVVSADVTTDA